MEVKDIKNRIREIKLMAGDYEVAHSKEDSLRDDVLREIARGCPNPSELAKEVLKTSKLDFARYCA